MFYNILLIVQIIVSAAMIVLILMQHGKGADAGAAFGSGASGTVFGSQGSANFLSRATAILATVFFLNSIGLAWMVSNRTTEFSSVMEAVQSTEEAAPAVPANTSDVPVVPGQEAAGTTQGSGVPAAPAAQSAEVPAAPAAQNAEVPAAPAAQSAEVPAAPAAQSAEVPAAPAADSSATQPKTE